MPMVVRLKALWACDANGVLGGFKNVGWRFYSGPYNYGNFNGHESSDET